MTVACTENKKLQNWGEREEKATPTLSVQILRIKN